MRTDVVARTGDMVGVARTEGPSKDTVYFAEYPKLQEKNDTVICRVTDRDWYEDLNTLLEVLDKHDIDYCLTRSGLTIEVSADSKFPVGHGMCFVGETPADAMKVFAQFLVDEAGISNQKDALASLSSLARTPSEFALTVVEDVWKAMETHE